jgi:aspartyl-tRNA(Asn)/glutamyl-tRNA(Gln) amidotransferase subunit C
MGTSAGTGHIDARYVADLARIELTDAEAARYNSQLNAILKYVEQLQEPDITGIEPTAHAMPLANVLRPDESRPSLDHAPVIRNAPADVDGVYVKVPAVIEGEEN